MKKELLNCISKWELEPEITFLNHGSFGACPKIVPPVNFSLMANQARERQSSLAQNLDRAETLIWNKLLARDF